MLGSARRHPRKGKRCLRIPQCEECSIRWTRGWWNSEYRISRRLRRRKARPGIKVVRRKGELAARSNQNGRNRFVGIDAAGARAAVANEGDAGHGVSQNR